MKGRKKNKNLMNELRKLALPNRNPDKVTEELYGRWEGRDISIEKARSRVIKS